MTARLIEEHVIPVGRYGRDGGMTDVKIHGAMDFVGRSVPICRQSTRRNTDWVTYRATAGVVTCKKCRQRLGLITRKLYVRYEDGPCGICERVAERCVRLLIETPVHSKYRPTVLLCVRCIERMLVRRDMQMADSGDLPATRVQPELL